VAIRVSPLQSGRRMAVDSRIILALDSNEIERCLQLITSTAESIAIYKLGLEFYLRNGVAGVKELTSKAPGIRIFLDLKLHDIPNTVAGAARSVANLAPEILTVHASGGAAMIQAAIAALPNTKIAAVTALTSLSEAQTKELFDKSPNELVLQLAEVALAGGAPALVASPQELHLLRSAFGRAPIIITPGIRDQAGSGDDQNRTMSAPAAIAAGADYLVIGRPITAAPDPAAAAANFHSATR